VVLLTSLLATGAAPAVARKSPRAHSEPKIHVSPQDAAATRAYLEAGYTYEQAVVANLPASKAAAEGYANKIGSECPGALASAQAAEHADLGGGARQFGESIRESEQLNKLEGEAGFALLPTWLQPDRQAAATLVGAVMALRWSNPTLTRLVHLYIAQFEEGFEAEAPNVCADIEAWVSSGYKTLSAGTKAFLSQREALARRAGPARSPSYLLAKYEGPYEKALIRRVRALEKEASKSIDTLRGVETRLRAFLGLKPLEAGPERPAQGSVVVSRGRTVAGEKYEVVVEPKEPSSGPEQGSCQVKIRIVGGSSSGCYSPTKGASPPSVNCGEGLLTIQAQTLPAARRVRLRLSDGHQITSRVAVVPAALGGPVGLYYQVVRGPSPIPVSLAELDAHDRTLRTHKLPRIVDCTKHTLKFLPGGIRTIVKDRAPGGAVFSIIGERYSFLGGIHFGLKVEIKNGGGGGESASGQKPNVLSTALWTGCEPHPYAIVYGLLKATHDTVRARVSGVLHPLRHVVLPASLHTKGVLVYIAAAAIPSELIVRSSDGQTIITEKFGKFEMERLEVCQGEEGEGGGTIISG
jgi:hypothetical protein